MKISKILIALIFCSFLVATIPMVSAADETVTDDEDDVIIYSIEMIGQSTTTDKPNLDITEITYTKNDQEVTLTMTLKEGGVIEDRGDLEFYNMVSYSFELITSDDTYIVTYLNANCTVTTVGDNFYIDADVSNYTSVDNVLTVKFDLINSSESFVSITGTSVEFDFTLIDLDSLEGLEDFESLEGYEFIFGDSVPDPDLIIESSYPMDGTDEEVGTEIDFSTFPFGGTPPYRYEWDFGDGQTSTEKNPTHSYDTPGDYSIIVTVKDVKNTEVSETNTITISEKQVINDDDDTTDDDNSTLILFGIVIAIIAIIGIITVVIIIRR